MFESPMKLRKEGVPHHTSKTDKEIHFVKFEG